MVVTRSMSGTTKKADTKVVVNHKVAERASKKTTAKRERERAIKKLTTAEKASRQARMKQRRLMEQARELFLVETFLPQFYEKNPDDIVTVAKNLEVGRSGDAEWASMTDSDKAPYVAKLKKRWADEMAFYEDFKQNRSHY